MSVNTARGQIYSALKDLRLFWQRTREQWDDDVARQFEERFWRPLDGTTVSVLGALDRLEQVLRRVRQECGDTGIFHHEEYPAE